MAALIILPVLCAAFVIPVTFAEKRHEKRIEEGRAHLRKARSVRL